MGFLEAYKRLEKLCGEVMQDSRAISAYISEMELGGAFPVEGWEEDLKNLKHYRWVRNQIVHETNCTEENMCDEDDIAWLNQFYARIMNQTDPLALYRKEKLAQEAARRRVAAARSRSATASQNGRISEVPLQVPLSAKPKKHTAAKFAVALIILLLIIIALIFFIGR